MSDDKHIELTPKDEELAATLRALPPLVAPDGVWSRIEGAISSPPESRNRVRRNVFLPAAASFAGLLIVTVAFWSGSRTNTSEDYAGMAAPFETSLVQESARLERILLSIPQRRGLMQVGTASTIVALENQLAIVDAELSYGAAAGLAPKYKTVLWSERVDLLNALVQVRAADYRRFEY